MLDLRDLWRAVSRDPFGSLLTLIGVVLGSASLVFLASGLVGAEHALSQSAQRASGDDVVRIKPQRPRGRVERAAPRLSIRDAEALRKKERLPNTGVSTGVTLYDRKASVDDETMAVGVQSGGRRWMQTAGLQILHGRMLMAHDDGKRRCVVGYDVWKELYGGKWPLKNPSLLFDGSTRLVVVGVLRRRPPIGGGGGSKTWRIDRKLFVTDATLTRAIEGGPHEPWITLRHESAKEDPKSASLRLKPYVTALHRGVENFSFLALGNGMALDDIITFVLTSVLALGGLVSILVGGINVMNSQLVTVAERAQELALRRALGLSAAKLRRNVLLESLTMAGCGASVGVVLGLLAAWGLSALLTMWVAPWPFQVVPWSVGASLVACSLAGLFAGWIPAKRAAELPPARVLRGE